VTVLEAAQLGVGWLALGAALSGMLAAKRSRWSWAGAGLMASVWLAVTQSAGLGVVLAAGILAAEVVEGPGTTIEPEFSRLTRHLALVLAALIAAVVVLVRLARVDAAEAPYVFPVLATGVVALVALFAGTERAEIHRAARVLLVTAAVGWSVATQGSEPAAVVALALALPLVGLSGRLRDQPMVEPER
jgi:Ni/Fe-hydrogenase subunit HybB-like protein